MMRLWLWWCLLLAATTSFQSTLTFALAPPHYSLIESGEYETVHQMRARLNISYAYSPQHLTDEHCKYWTEEECMQYDQELGHAKRNRHGRRLNPSTGKYVVPVLLIYFPEDAGIVDTTLPKKDYIDTLWNADGISDINPVGSIRQWLLYNTLNQYDVTFDIIDWQVAAESEAFYAGGRSGQRNPVEMAQLAVPILERMDANGHDWTKYNDGTGKLAHLAVITSGFPAEIAAGDCAPPSTDRIWSQGVATLNPDVWTSSDGSISLNGFTISSAWTFPACETPTTMGIGLHEYLHGFNLPDLYDFDSNEGTFGIAGVGSFDMMCNAYGWNNNAAIPGHAGPYIKQMAGWLQPIELTENGVYTIQPSELSGQVLKISKNYPNQEYLLIENRWGVKWDSDWTCRGIVIWHVDDAAPLQSNRGYPGHPNWPTDHYRVAVLQADGNYDIENLRNLGDAGDCWGEGTTLPADTNTWPNTASYQGALQSTGITITINTPSSFVVQIKVSGL